jgi:hypothetical protein
MVGGAVRFVACAHYSPGALAQALTFLRRNLTRFPFQRLVSHVFPLERISEGFRHADWMNRQGGTAHVSRAAVGMG